MLAATCVRVGHLATLAAVCVRWWWRCRLYSPPNKSGSTVAASFRKVAPSASSCAAAAVVAAPSTPNVGMRPCPLASCRPRRRPAVPALAALAAAAPAVLSCWWLAAAAAIAALAVAVAVCGCCMCGRSCVRRCCCGYGCGCVHCCGGGCEHRCCCGCRFGYAAVLRSAETCASGVESNQLCTVVHAY